MKRFYVFCLLVIFFLFPISHLTAADYYTITNERGDTVNYQYPPIPGTYVKNHIMVRFKESELIKSVLCYEPEYYEDKMKSNYTLNVPSYQISYLMGQRFPISDLVNSSQLLSLIQSFGGTYFKRMTWANPCSDTISQTRNGLYIGCDDYLWMILELSNDTSAVNAAIALTIFGQSHFVGAEIDYYLSALSEPADYYYPQNQSQYQKSLHQNGIAIERAWDFEVGSYDIKVAVIDDGIDWRNCDFGGDFGPGQKVSTGWNIPKLDDVNSMYNIVNISPHGTQVAGIIGALTNRECHSNFFSNSSDSHIAGIAGGWGTMNNAKDLGIGCQLLGYKITKTGWSDLGDTAASSSSAVSAIRMAATKTNNPSGYGDGVHIMNLSWKSDYYSEFLRAAIAYAFENGVSIVAARGNYGSLEVIRNKDKEIIDVFLKESVLYPCNYDPSWLSSVGGSDMVSGSTNIRKSINSSWGKGTDFLAPFGDPGLLIFTTDPCNNNQSQWSSITGTSGSAPHVSGILALLRSYSMKNNNHHYEPEDFEGIIKSSTNDITGSVPIWNSPNLVEEYLEKYDLFTGWGAVRADNLFNMLHSGYKLHHYSTSNISYGQWEPNDKIDFAFYNSSDKSNKYLANGNYKIKYRECYGEIDYSTSRNIDGSKIDWLYDNNNPLFSWGRSNKNQSGGFSLANPNYQLSYTKVISGEGGNGLVDGIFHQSNSTISGLTYQFDVWDINDNYIGRFPPDDKITINISIFGKESFTSVVKDYSNNNIIIFPNPADNYFDIQINNNLEKYSNFIIYDIYGNEVLGGLAPISEQYTRVSTKHFANGVYFVKFISTNSVQIQKIIVLNK